MKYELITVQTSVSRLTQINMTVKQIVKEQVNCYRVDKIIIQVVDDQVNTFIVKICYELFTIVVDSECLYDLLTGQSTYQ